MQNNISKCIFEKTNNNLKAKLLIILISSLIISCDNHNQEEQNGKIELEIELVPDSFISGLPGQLAENSGLIYFNNLLWSFNDSGGENVIYGFNRSGELIIEVLLDNAENNDWEDIAQDEEFIYVGDFGNNSGSRKDLKVYKISKSDITDESQQTVQAEIIGFSFSDQDQFSFLPQSTPYDCESVTIIEKEIYLFTKNWKDETTTVYNLPKTAGEYAIVPRDSFETKGLITGADFNPETSTLVLVGYHDYKPLLWLFENVSKENFFDRDNVLITMNSLIGAQTEGVCFLGSDTLLISCENTFNYQAQVFMVDLKKLN
jgi:hypothetical protein